MNNASALLRTLVVYAVCVPLAIWLGFTLTSLEDLSRKTFIEVGIFALLMFLPLLLRWHYILLVSTLSLGVTVFFLPGRPPVWMLMLALSLGISIVQRTLNRGMHFISAPRLAWPMICLAVVVLATCKLTGGIGLNSLGSENVGGKKYFFVFGGILAYFALTARRIPAHQAVLYMALYFLPPCLNAIGDLVSLLPSSFNFIYWLFPANNYIMGETLDDAAGFRYVGLSAMAMAVFTFMLAKHGIRGIFLSGKPWRIVLFFGFSSLAFMGGFRSMLITMALIFSIQFYLEGLHRTQLLPRFAFTGLLAFGLILPFAQHLPYAAQRALSFLPVTVNTEARENAVASAEWRYQIWEAEFPQVPQYLLLGKGYAISAGDFEFVGSRGFRAFSADELDSAVAGDYHNGPLSVVLPFGIWGVIAFIWLWVAGVRALYDNFRFGEESLRTVNTLLLAAFVAHILIFIFIFGALESDTLAFAAMLGLSVSINGGIRGPVTEQVKAAVTQFNRPRLQAVFQR
jgi:hypothetical protein